MSVRLNDSLHLSPGKDNPSSPRKTLKMCKVKLLVESFLRRSNICGFETNNYDTKKY